MEPADSGAVTPVVDPEASVAVPVAPVAPVADVAPVVEPAGPVAASAPAAHPFVSLYDSAGTTLVAIALGVFIVGGIQIGVARIFARAQDEHRALTQFVVSMVAIMVGVYVSDMLIAGPTAELLAEGERSAILSFVKDTALMIFAYYFGTKASNAER